MVFRRQMNDSNVSNDVIITVRNKRRNISTDSIDIKILKSQETDP